jgi:hypothetical protein
MWSWGTVEERPVPLGLDREHPRVPAAQAHELVEIA